MLIENRINFEKYDELTTKIDEMLKEVLGYAVQRESLNLEYRSYSEAFGELNRCIYSSNAQVKQIQKDFEAFWQVAMLNSHESARAKLALLSSSAVFGLKEALQFAATVAKATNDLKTRDEVQAELDENVPDPEQFNTFADMSDPDRVIPAGDWTGMGISASDGNNPPEDAA